MEFTQVTMLAASVAAQRHFYGEVLGFEVLVDKPSLVVIQAGRARLAFQQAPDGERPTYHCALRVPGNRFRDAKQWLLGRVELLRDGGSDEFDWSLWGARAVYFTDPAGNCIELIAFEGLAPSPDRGFSARSILGVAELGLPVGDVHLAAKLLRQQLGIGLWDRAQVLQSGITPLGERGATFILVPAGRAWYLGAVSAPHPLDVRLSGVRPGALRLWPHPYFLRGSSSNPGSEQFEGGQA